MKTSIAVLKKCLEEIADTSNENSGNGFMAEGGHIRYSGVEVSAFGIGKPGSPGPSDIILRNKIRRITLCNGTDVQNPFSQFGAGFVLLFLGLVGLIAELLTVIGQGHPVQSEPGSIMVPLTLLALFFLAAIGFRILAGVFRVKFFFLIETKKDAHRIFFGESANADEIKEFIWIIKKRFGYAINIPSFSAEPQTE